MKEKTSKLITLVLLGISIIGTVFAVFHAMGSDPKNMLDGIVELNNPQSALFDVVFWILGAFFAISIALILFYALKSIKFGKPLIILTISAAVVIGASFLLSTGNDISPIMLEKYNTSVGQSRLVGAACIMVYILFIASIATIIFVEIANSFKKK